jgi:hypothetical protein
LRKNKILAGFSEDPEALKRYNNLNYVYVISIMMKMKTKINKTKSKELNFIAAIICGAVGGNIVIYSIGEIFILKSIFYEEYLFGPLLAWTGFGVGLVFIVASIFFVRECFRIPEEKQ